MDNQQGRHEVDMHWLGGIIDGEGCVTAIAGHTKTGKGHTYDHRRYVPQINIVNTDPNIVDQILTVLKRADIPHYVTVRKAGKKNPHWKTKTEILIYGMKRCLNAANKLLPYLRSEKKRKLELLKQWIEYRLGAPSKSFRTPHGGGMKKPYTEEDYRLLNLIRNTPCTLRDHTLSPDNKSGEDMIRSTVKAVV